MMRRTPLAWKNLIHRPRRAVVAIGGVTFAVFLMFMELGFLWALLDSTVFLIHCLHGDLFLINPAKFALVVPERFPRQRLLQARMCGVEAYPLCMESAYAILRRPGNRGYPIRVLALDVTQPLVSIPGFAATDWSTLLAPYTAAYDTASKRRYGLPKGDHASEVNMELVGRPIQLRGRFRLCTDFATDGTLIMSLDNFLRYFPTRAPAGEPVPTLVDIGILRVHPPTNVAVVKECLVQHLPHDVVVLTKEEFVAREQRFWLRNTPIGYIFVIGTAIGFIVGMIICYQIVYAELEDHTREFATLAAMGYSHSYFMGIVTCQALYLSIAGFVPALALTVVVYHFLGEVTGLLLILRPSLAVLVFATTVVMCLGSGILAVRHLRRVDPASLFS